MNLTDRFSTSIADEKDRSRCFNHGDELIIDRSWHAYAYTSMHECYNYTVSMRAINIALASYIYTRLFIHGLQLRKPRELVKSDQQYLSEKVLNTQLLKYSLDICVSYSTSSSLRKAPSRPKFSHNYLIDYLINYTIITS